MPRKQFPRGIVVHARDNLARMSLTCHGEIGRRTCRMRMLQDSNDLSATSRACRAHGIWRTTLHTDIRAALHRSRPPADQSDKSVASWTGKSPDTPDTRDILACRACRRVRHEHATRMLRGNCLRGIPASVRPTVTSGIDNATLRRQAL